MMKPSSLILISTLGMLIMGTSFRSGALAAAPGEGSASPTPAPSPTRKPDALLELSVKGSPYQVGHSIGWQMKGRIQEKVNSIQSLIEYTSEGPGKEQYEAMLNAVKEEAKKDDGANAFADALEELEGMAAGAQVDFKDVVVINMENDLHALKGTYIDHCSDVLVRQAKCDDDPVNGQKCLIIAHNEDGGPSNFDKVHLLKASIEGRGGTLNIQAYNYPGQLSTGAFGFNYDSQIFFSTNAVFPKDVNSTGVPRHFLARYIIAAGGIDEAIERATQTKLACGFSLNIGSWGKNGETLHNIELASNKQYSILNVEDYTFHFNIYLRLNVPQHVGASSVARMKAAKSLPIPQDTDSIFRILGDTSNSSYPIYRNGNPPDGIATLTTAVFKVPLSSGNLRTSSDNHKEPTMEVIMNNPRFADPLFVYGMESESISSRR